MSHPETRNPRRALSVETLEHKRLLAGDVVVNEFMAANSGALLDADGDSSDWIELFNPTENSIDLTGWHLSDDLDNLTKWTLPNESLGPGEYLLVFASGKDRISGELHANFRLRADGEALLLTEPDGETVSFAYSPEFPEQRSDVSFGIPVGRPSSDATFLAAPTPGGENSAAQLTEIVTFSHVTPTFSEPFLLTLDGAGPNQSIAYTLDGSPPTADSTKYAAPFLVEATTLVRARIVAEAAVGPIRSQGYSQLSPDVVEFSSGLPILLIENFGQGDIPNKGFPSQTGADTFQQPRQTASIAVFEQNEQNIARLGREVDLHHRIGIRVRGAFSATFSEPGYSLEFWDESDSDIDVAPLDLLPHSDWVLYAPNPVHERADRTLIDNTFLFSVSQEMGHWAPSFRYLEAFVNTGGDEVTMSDHVGLYVLEDKVDRGAGRIEFDRLSSAGDEGGWLLTVNRMDAIPEDDPNSTPQHFHTAGPDGILETPPNASGVGDDIPRQHNAFLNFEDPNGYRINSAQRATIETWFAEMEDVLYGRTDVGWNDPDEGYPQYIDSQSFIDYFILNNISNNGDGFLLSMWLYNPEPNGSGKLTMGPIWDADLRSFQFDPLGRLRENVDRLWYGRMFEDPDFVQQYVDRWFELRASTLSEERLVSIIDDLARTITLEAAERDGVPDWPTRLDDMKAWLARRLPALDRLFVQPARLSRTDQGFDVSANGEVYYTLDGSDPRTRGGQPSDTAQRVEGVVLRLESAVGEIIARVFDDGAWSAKTQVRFSTTAGDVDNDGQVNASDIDLLVAAIRQGETTSEFDLNGDEVVNEADVDYLVESILQTRRGDANLDGSVDFNDFLTLSANFGTGASWSGGNFDVDTIVDFDDFLTLADNFRFESENIEIVDETP